MGRAPGMSITVTNNSHSTFKSVYDSRAQRTLPQHLLLDMSRLLLGTSGERKISTFRSNYCLYGQLTSFLFPLEKSLSYLEAFMISNISKYRRE